MVFGESWFILQYFAGGHNRFTIGGNKNMNNRLPFIPPPIFKLLKTVPSNHKGK